MEYMEVGWGIRKEQKLVVTLYKYTLLVVWESELDN